MRTKKITTLAAQPSKKVSIYNYGEALQKAIMFYEFQRSGELPSDIRNNWRGDSGLSDGSDAGIDLTGGWYDAGDHVKFNLPMAYSATMLAWSVYEAEDALKESGQLEYLLKEIKWATDYLIKCHPSANVFYYQVGNGNTDHSWWGPAEVMQMGRPSYRVDLNSPGSSVSAAAAAALAAAAVIYADRDPSYALTCIQHAKELFSFADKTKSDSGYTAANGFYTSSSGFYDELSWSCVWLYIATKDSDYLDKAESYVPNWGTESQSTTISYKWAQCWDDVHNGAALLLAKLTGKEVYRNSTEMHLDYWTTGYNGSRISYTPKGLAWLDTWGSLRYATTTAFLASVYADWPGCSANKVETYKNFAKQQIDYALGSSGRSFLVGYGVNSPKRPHHRTAHSSWADSMSVPAYHRHTLYGALAGGPDKDDSYTDEINNYVNNEVACDYNAGFVGALAKLYGEYGGDPIADFKAVEEVTNDESFVEAGINASGSNFIEIKAIINNCSGWPARMGDHLSFKYFVDIKVNGNRVIERLYATLMPAPFLSVVTDDCIAKGKDYNAGGARYNTSYIQGVGIGTITDSLSAIKYQVFDEKNITIEELMEALKSNFEGHEDIYHLVKNKTPKYGNDDDYADEIMKEVFDAYYNEVNGRPNGRGGCYRIDMLPTTCHVYFGSVINATPDGRKAHLPVSEGISPSKGADVNGPTGVIKSAAKMDHLRTGGTLLNQKFVPSVVQGEEGIDNMANLVRAYFTMDGHHIQFNIVSKETLLEAQQNPDEYKDLIVRVAGYSDYFNNLDKVLQNEIIERTEQEF